MLKLIEKFARGGMHQMDMVSAANAFLYKHKPVPMPPSISYKYEAEED